MNKKTRIITVANQKGGVGKTTSAVNLGVALAQMGHRVLLVDSDPQANLTSYLGVIPGVEPYSDLSTLDELYLSKKIPKGDQAMAFVTQTNSQVDLLPADQALSGVEYYLFSRPGKEKILRTFLSEIQSHYDFVLIDTPPSLNLLTINALCASDGVLIPVQPEFFSLEGIVKIRQIISDIKQMHQPDLSVLGVLPTQVSERRRLTREVIEALREELGEILFESCIHDNAAVTESSGHGKSVIEYQRSSKGSKDYLQAAKELVERTQSLPGLLVARSEEIHEIKTRT